jgi:hypothetical protein
MDMQTLLALVMVLAIIRPTIVMVMIAVVIMIAVVVMVVAMMNMAWLIAGVRVYQKAGKCTDGQREGHADGGRDGKHNRHRPNDGDAASAHSLHARQHRLRPFSSSIDYGGVAFVRPISDPGVHHHPVC